MVVVVLMGGLFWCFLFCRCLRRIVVIVIIFMLNIIGFIVMGMIVVCFDLISGSMLMIMMIVILNIVV